MKKRKAISPIIATVLLIAVAVAIGVLVSTWITKWTLETTESASTSACAASTIYDLSDTEYNTSSKILKTIVTNKGSQEIYNFSLEVANDTHVIRDIYPMEGYQVSYTDKLKTQQSAILKFDLTDKFSGNFQYIKIFNKACPDVTKRLSGDKIIVVS
jgi:flagellin-like protein